MTQPSNFKLTLLNIQSPTSSEDFQLVELEIVIGREDSADLTIPSQAVSRRHAKLTREGDGYVIEDLGSSNGTFVNSQKVTGKRRLNAGDQIRLGNAVTLVYDAPRAPAIEAPDKFDESAATIARLTPKMPSSVMVTSIGEEPLPSMVDAGPPRLVVTIAGENPRTHTLTNQSLSLGRSEGNDIVIPSQIVSGNHARLEKAGRGYKVTMLPEAKNPILVEGRPLEGARELRHGDILRIGSLDPGLMVTMTYDAPSQTPQEIEQDIVFGENTLIQIGRDTSNDVVLPSPNVSRFHAQVERVGQRFRVEDLRSSNGTFVNGEQIEGSIWLKPEDTIRIGQYRFVMGRDQLAKYDDSNGLRVDAINLNKWVRKDL
ncbi:MAG TPA: FHA domain-containing protein, partial [Anaerolineales bacterium]